MKTYNVILLIRVLLLYSFSNVSVLLIHCYYCFFKHWHHVFLCEKVNEQVPSSKTFGPCEVTPCTMTNYMLLLLQLQVCTFLDKRNAEKCFWCMVWNVMHYNQQLLSQKVSKLSLYWEKSNLPDWGWGDKALSRMYIQRIWSWSAIKCLSIIVTSVNDEVICVWDI